MFSRIVLNRRFAAILTVASLAAVALAAASAVHGQGPAPTPPPASTATPSPNPLPPEPPPGLLENCGVPWPPDDVPTPTIASPSDLEVSLNAEELEVILTWQDNADNEICFGVVKTFPPEGPPSPAPVAIITPPDTTGTIDRGFPAQGLYCYQVFAGNADGLSAPSNEACVEVPASFVLPSPGSLPPTGGPPNGGGGFSWWPLVTAGAAVGVIAALWWRRRSVSRL